MPISKASSSAVAPGAKGDLVVGTTTNDSGILAVGSANQVLTVDSSTATGLKWAAAGGGGLNWTLLNAGGTALTGASTITVSGISDKEYLLVEVSGASSGVSQDEFRFRINADSGGNYNNFGTSISTASAYSANNFTRIQATNTSIINFAQMTSDATSSCGGFMFITGGKSSGIKTYQVVGGSNVVSTSANGVHYNIAGHYVGSAAVSSISIISANSSNFDAGTIWVYGA